MVHRDSRTRSSDNAPPITQTRPQPMDLDPTLTPGLPRRLAALFYDGVLLFALLLVATGVAMGVQMLVVGGPSPVQGQWLRAWLFLVISGFFAYFWTHGGQTLGMSAWRLRLVRTDGGNPRLPDALLRLACATIALAPAGLGLWWVLIDPKGLAWHDRWSRTRLILVQPPAKPAGTQT